MKDEFDKTIRLKLLKLLLHNSNLTQRQMKQQMGVSLGKVNYCLSRLSEKGMIKVDRFKKSDNKSAYIYRITPTGIDEITRLTFKFLKKKIKEYDAIQNEIAHLSEELNEIDPDLGNTPELKKELDRIKKQTLDAGTEFLGDYT